ncbi:hypothetical protein NMD99_02990 [Wolbachia endosymbiont of Listronotus oregonensis]|nr:hypothetical protein [Wolbachia endosymbiont of Listronotus oregonensis]WMT84955.1 hypothetical protein NMD99_02990 [Wolbachia endosymbiont of Listronotus oregonensis]
MLAGSMLRDTANESRYDGLRRYDGSRWHDDNFVIPLLVSRYLEIP